jgi:hypothetical protein
MPGLVPAIHVSTPSRKEKDVDGREDTPRVGMAIRRKFTGSYAFCSNFQHRIRKLALPVVLILGKQDGGSRWDCQSAAGRNG